MSILWYLPAKLPADSRAIYALGQLALWIPDGEQSGIRELKDLAGSQVKFIAIAQPEVAPYGAATVEVLKGTGLWELVQPKLVYGTSVSMAKQYAASGSANAAFTAYSLVLHDRGTVLKIDSRLHKPLSKLWGLSPLQRTWRKPNNSGCFCWARKAGRS